MLWEKTVVVSNVSTNGAPASMQLVLFSHRRAPARDTALPLRTGNVPQMLRSPIPAIGMLN